MDSELTEEIMKRHEAELRLQQALLARLDKKIGLMVEVLAIMDRRVEGMYDEMDDRSREAEYKFEIAFKELGELNELKKRAEPKGRDVHKKRLGSASGV